MASNEHKLVAGAIIPEESKIEVVKLCSGSVVRCTDDRGSSIAVVQVHGAVSKQSFSWYLHGGEAKATIEAWKYVHRVSDENELTEVHSFPVATPELQQYFAGFVDGDGTVGMVTSGGEGRFASPMLVSVCQATNDHTKTPPIITLFETYFGGSIVSHVPEKLSHKVIFRVDIRGNLARRLLSIIEKHGVLKHEQASKLLQLVGHLRNDTAVLHTKDREANKNVVNWLATAHTTEAYQNVAIEGSRMTLAWIAGFYDAEGCVIVTLGGLEITWTQRSSPDILLQLKARFKVGGISQAAFALTGLAAANALREMLPYLVVKKEQAVRALAFFDEDFALPNCPARQLCREKARVELIAMRQTYSRPDQPLTHRPRPKRSQKSSSTGSEKKKRRRSKSKNSKKTSKRPRL